jgi:hypothetical protein
MIKKIVENSCYGSFIDILSSSEIAAEIVNRINLSRLVQQRILLGNVVHKLIQECLLERYSQRAKVEDDKLHIFALMRDEDLFAEKIQENLEKLPLCLSLFVFGCWIVLDFTETSVLSNFVFHLEIDEFEEDKHQPV